jgi:hypothetical protein
MTADVYAAPCPGCKLEVRWFAFVLRLGRQTTYRCVSCGWLKTWTARW